MKEERKPGYWLDRLREDNLRLDESRKRRLTRALLEYGIPLSPEEADLFVDLEPNSTDTDRISRYCEVERKVGDAYSGRSRLFVDPQLRRSFLTEFRSTLEGFYTREELDELISYMGNCEGLAVMILVGEDHPTIRRIRNAYLPEMVDLISVGNNGAEDITHTLFDREGDAVSQIDELLGKKKPE